MKDQLLRYREDLRTSGAGEALAYFMNLFPGQCVFSSSLGAEDQVLMHIIASSYPQIPVFTLDTGRLFQETYELISITEQKYNTRIRVYYPDAAQVENMVNARGINLFYDSVENRKECCGTRKVESLKRALGGMKVWVTGLRREQSAGRLEMEKVEWDEALGMIKLNPLIDWTVDEIWDYIRLHKIPYNSLHDKGFPSIGCLPCTRAVLPGEDVRAGRWWWEDGSKKECGLHTDEK